MIDPREVQKFLNEYKDNWAWVKKLTEAQLDDELDRIGFKVARRGKPLRKHQKACALIALAMPYFSFWLDMGTGKTRLMLEVMRHFMLEGDLRQVLILCPSEQSVYTWEEQIATWRINIPYVALGNSPSDDKWDTLAELDDFGFVIATYPGLVWMLSKKKPKKDARGRVVKNKRGEPIIKLTRQDKLVKRFAKYIDAVVMDESTKLGNQGSTWFQCARAISKAAKRRYALAGRPFGRDPTLVWSQQWLVDRGDSLGDTLGLFRQGFFQEKKAYFGGFTYTFDNRMEDDLAEMMAHRSITYASSECQSLPPLTDIIERVKLPMDAALYYERAVAALIAARGNFTETRNTFLRMRQISSGFLGYKDDETGERAQLVFPTNPKLERTLELIDEISLDRKFVVFHEFTHSGRVLQEAIEDELKIKTIWLHGGIKNSRQLQESFDNNKKVRGAIVNNKLGSMSLNLQVANYAFTFEAPVSPIDWEQLRKRIHRDGQDLHSFLYDMRCKGTVDDKIRQFHEEGDNLFKAVLRDPYNIAV